MTLYEMLGRTLYYQEVWIYNHNTYDQNMPIFKGEVEDARRYQGVWDYLTCDVDHYECDTGILLIYVKDEFYEKRLEEGNYKGSSEWWGRERNKRPWLHSAEIHEDLRNEVEGR